MRLLRRLTTREGATSAVSFMIPRLTLWGVRRGAPV
jgi:hypothetical protein